MYIITDKDLYSLYDKHVYHEEYMLSVQDESFPKGKFIVFQQQILNEILNFRLTLKLLKLFSLYLFDHQNHPAFVKIVEVISQY